MLRTQEFMKSFMENHITEDVARCAIPNARKSWVNVDFFNLVFDLDARNSWGNGIRIVEPNALRGIEPNRFFEVAQGTGVEAIDLAQLVVTEGQQKLFGKNEISLGIGLDSPGNLSVFLRWQEIKFFGWIAGLNSAGVIPARIDCELVVKPFSIDDSEALFQLEMVSLRGLNL